MPRWFHVLALGLAAHAAAADPACCYFSAMDKDVKQPGQRVFITYDPAERMESFTVQAQFEGDAVDFGMVVPTPAQPQLAEAHRDLFKTLAVFTILRPLDDAKWQPRPQAKFAAAQGADVDSVRTRGGVRVLEAGVVGSLDYKVVEASDAQGLYAWLESNGYAYAGDPETLDFYIRKRWFFTVMKIDPKQMKRRADGSYQGEVTPTRFTFETDRLIYPLRITRISVAEKTDALFYIQAPEKMDFPGELSYQPNFQAMWYTAFSTAIWERHGETDKAWWAHVEPRRDEIFREFKDQLRNGRPPSTLEWARRLGDADLALIADPTRFDREAPPEDVAQLATLAGLLRRGQFLTKCRHVFYKDEMSDDLVFVPASYKDRADAVEYVEIMPSSPP